MEQVKDTAVQWLIQQLECRLEILSEHKLFEQAKAMEKEQIMGAYECGYSDGYFEGSNSDDFPEFDNRFEQYYNETYGK